ncbi:MAG: calcium/sodium antiporter [Pseudomonadales bacterium]|nr:calcium/sodium antiporter [Pseudomonadales bacterium]
MLLAFIAIIVGLAILVWSADRFVAGSSVIAMHFSVPPLLIGMVIVGFGTSAPEMSVSILAALQNNSGIALGNAYGSNIANIALILGLTAMISPVIVRSHVLRKELPLLTGVTVLAAWQLWDGTITRLEASGLLAVFVGLMAWTIWQGLHQGQDVIIEDINQELDGLDIPIRQAVVFLVSGLVLLIISSRILVWGAVEIAQGYGVSDLIIGLTIVAVGTSLPELASSVVAARKGEHDIALGNVLGSNLFNTLAVVGIAGVIQPMVAGPEVFNRDMLVMLALTIGLFIMGYGFRAPGHINRIEGVALLVCYFSYVAYLIVTAS